MKQIIECLTEEVSLLREILTNLKIEENALMTPEPKNIEHVYMERHQLETILQKVKSGKKRMEHQIVLFKEDPEIQTLIDQIVSLEEHITKQVYENNYLKTRFPLLQEQPQKKRRLLLEDDSR